MNPELGLALVNPTAGTTIRFVATAGSTGGDYVEVEATYPPASAKPPKHLHPSQEERFTVVSGSLEVVCGDETFVASAGEEFVTGVGVPHQMWAGPDGAVFHWRSAPALRTGEMFCRLWECSRDNGWDPTPLQLFEVVSGFADEFCLA